MSDNTVPIIVDLGKKKKRALRALERGRGKLVDEVTHVIDDVSMGLGEERSNKLIVPIVVVYRRKNRKRRGLLG